MKRLLLTILLLTQFGLHATGVARGQDAPTAAGAASAGQSDALKEAASLSGRVVQLYQAGKFDEALPLAERALKLREETAGREHQSVADALKNLGAIYSARGKIDKARQLYTRALSIYEKNPVANNASIYDLLDALGLMERFAFSNFSTATGHYERSLALKQASLGEEHDEVVKTLYDLAELYELLNQNDKAVAAHRRVIGVREKREATFPDELVVALSHFACLSDRLGMKAEAAEAKRRAEELNTARVERRKRAAAAAQNSPDEAIQGGIINGRAISKPHPYYPAQAKRQRVTGTVMVFVTVDETGRVVLAHACGHPLLSESSLRAAYSARFTPMLLDGKPVKMRGAITYRFVLQ